MAVEGGAPDAGGSRDLDHAHVPVADHRLCGAEDPFATRHRIRPGQ